MPCPDALVPCRASIYDDSSFADLLDACRLQARSKSRPLGGDRPLNASLHDTWILLAQDAAEAPTGPNMLLPIVAIMLLFYFLILRPQKKKEQDMRTMVDNLKEKDRVVTIGGIHGVVTNVQRDQDLVAIRVDEATGAKIRVGTSAIARVVVDDDKTEKSN